MHRLHYCLTVLLFSLVILAGCERSSDLPASNTLATGYWQMRITVPGGDIEGAIEISRHSTGYVASLLNGQERVPIDEVRFADGELTLRFPAFNNEIVARLEDGKLIGELILVKQRGATQSMPFVATHGAARNDAPVALTGEQDLSGRWAVTFHEPDGSNAQSVGEFSQRGSRLFGTFLNPNGDFRYLSGYVRGKEFNLSTFDGAHAFLFTGTIDGDTIRDGQFWSGTSWHQTWSGKRNANAFLPDAYTRTHLKPGYERFEFEFPDLDGNLVSLDDERFAGKVVVVTLAGTWCPNCHDEARFIAPLYKTLRSKGLEVVALMYEHFDDPELAARQVAEFRRKFGIEYTTLIAGISSKTEAAETLPALNAVLAFPTTIFIDRNGTVRRIHTGFNGPGTGDHYKQLTGDITAFITQLIAEPQAAPAAEPVTEPAAADTAEDSTSS